MAVVTPSYSSGSIRGVSYSELADSMRLDISGGSAVGTRRFRVAWADRFNFVRAILGEHVWINGELQMFSGAQTFPGYDPLAAREISIAGEGRIANSAGEISFTSAIVTVRYLPTIYDEEEKDEEERVLSTEEMDFSGEFMLTPEGSLKWGQYYWSRIGQSGDALPDAGKPVQQQGHVLLPTIDYVYTKHNVYELPKTAIQACLGKVNDGNWPPAAPGRQTIPAGYLLFAGGSARRTITSEGRQPYEVRLMFRYRMPAWNYIWHGGDDNDRPWAKTNPPLYEEADFDPLIKFVDGES